MTAVPAFCRRLAPLLVLLCLASAAAAEEPVRHRFLALDFMHGKLWCVDQIRPDQSWSEPWGGGVRDLQLIGNQQLLVTRPDGFTVYNLQSRAMVREVKLPALNGVVTARRLADGRTWLGANVNRDGKSAVTVFELSAEGTLARQVAFPQLRTLRMMRRTAQDTLLLAEYNGVAEVTVAPEVPDAQRLIRQFPLPRPRNAYMALRLADGRTLVAGGYAAGLFEYAADGTLLGERVACQPAGLQNWFYAGLQVLRNGHVLLANWNGHNDKDFKPGWRLIEMDRDGRVVWFWDGQPEGAGSINGILVLDGLDPTLLNDDAAGILGPS